MKATTLFLLAIFVAIAKAGDPIPDIDVSIVKSSGGALVKMCKTDGRGNFACVGIPPGDYRIKMSGGSLMINGSHHTLLSQVCTVQTAREAGSGMATGRRQYSPIRFQKIVDGDERQYTFSVTCSSDSIWGSCMATINTTRSNIKK